MLRGAGLAGLAAILAGCGQSGPYRMVKARLDPAGRSMAIMPFLAERDVKPSDGIVLSLWTQRRLKAELPDLNVIGPREIMETLGARIPVDVAHRRADPIDVARKLGVRLVLVGQMTLFDMHFDNEILSWCGTIRVRFRVLDVSSSPPVVVGRAEEQSFGLPEGLGQKYGTQFAARNKEPHFRRALFQHAAERIAWFFFDHREETWTVNRTTMRTWKEQ